MEMVAVAAVNRETWLLTVQTGPCDMHFACITQVFRQVFIIAAVRYKSYDFYSLVIMLCCLVVIYARAVLSGLYLVFLL